MSTTTEKIEFLSSYLTKRRKALIDQVLAQRTDQITLVLEDVYHAQNISAAIRTAECFGIQDIHIVERLHQYQVNPRIVRGSAKWLNLVHYHMEDYQDPSQQCINTLKNQGFTIYATSPAEEALPMNEVIFNGPSAFIFGTEFTGITDSAARLADHLIRIPMYGFTESFNISVSVALILQTVKNQFTVSGHELSLSAERREQVKLDWYKKAVKHADHLLTLFEKE